MFLWCYWRKLSRRKALQCESLWRARCIFSNCVRDLVVALESVCVVLSRSAAPQKDRLLCPSAVTCQHDALSSGAEKRVQSFWLACRSHCPDEGSEQGIMLVKFKQTSWWNMQKAELQQLTRPSSQSVSLILHTYWGLTCFTKFWSFWDMESRAGKLFICVLEKSKR